jgi:chromate transporter
MTIGFLTFAGLRFLKVSVNNLVTVLICCGSITITYFLFRTPWIFPILLVCGGFITNLSDKRIPEREIITPRQIRWRNIWLFIAIFALAGILSEASRKNTWTERKSLNLFENFYRFGSIVFGGGDVLLPIMLDQYVVRPDAPRVKIINPNALRMDKEELLTGYGIVRAIPGPVFSIASYSGGVMLKDEGRLKQAMGCLIGSIAIFLPSTLLLFFFFPVWQNLKKYVVVYRALEGIYAVVTGFMLAGAIYLLTHAGFFAAGIIDWFGIFVVVTTTLLLWFTRVPPPFLVLACLLLGWIF